MAPRPNRPPDDAIVAGRRPVLELLRSGRPVKALLVARDLRDSEVVRELKESAARAGVATTTTTRAEIDRIAKGLNHQGVVAEVGRYRYAPLEDLLKDARHLLFVDGVTDPHNLGSLLRSADGSGFSGVVIPAHRASGVTATVRRVSAGAAEIVPVARVTNLGRALDQARGSGFWVVGLDEKAGETIWETDALEPPVALVLGSEGKGISRGVLGRCDSTVRIPSQGRLASLNVAVAGAIAMFEATRRGETSDTL
ncbi:MAG TPA: 23S rRNA (guanosine(2251)-2'-O)-methyltransferase RlmB [Actinomycetota bacterium]|nr:23S rRNA (guanosine(2251)-2'-O)-methyltransferase RlmB [Actinomycetota bacterium]